MILYIDSTDFNKVTYSLKPVKGKMRQKKTTINHHQSHKALEVLATFLARQTKEKITAIVVNTGPGSYTGTRVGVTHALALGFAWNVPVKPLEKEKFYKKLLI